MFWSHVVAGSGGEQLQHRFQTVVRSEIGSVQPLFSENDRIPLSFEVGSPLSASGLVPRVQVRWLDGSPAQDQTVMMMAVYNLSWAFDTTVRKAFAPVGPNAKGFYDPTKLNFGDQ